ncbi:hypothetical protein OOJ91_13845 [Micromonospora lupini]|uniref:hypothetical protein n=1 Tax=Micromonospora lupini TaxID=285679 RepID=UPI00224DE866|nr:hypothetical protein [Micromonospora lupini]MCX5066930.1 hypothetical protein [Micromonospora lupini]
MGTSTNGILAYGYHFGSEDSLLIREAQESDTNPDGYFVNSWYDYRTTMTVDYEKVDGALDPIEAMTKRLYDSIPDAPPAEDDWDRANVVKGRLGVWFEAHCSGDYPMYVLTTKVLTAHRGDADVVPISDLRQRQDEWDGLLARALQLLDVTPTQARPEWLLCSYWG